MIHELQKSDYKLVKDLVNPKFISVQLESVINGTNPGYVYADALGNPEAAIVYHQGEGRFYFIGNPESERLLEGMATFMASIKEAFIENDIREFEFSGDCQEWNDKFHIIFSKYDLYESTQRVYLYSESEYKIVHPLDEAFEIKAIDETFINQRQIKGISFIEDEILTWWDSFEEYLSNNMGLVAVRYDKIVGRCLLDGKTETLMAIGIAVKDKHKGNGVASALASTMINHIIEHGYSPYWECMDDNEPSIKIAEKCGLKLAFTYKIFGFTI